MNTLKYGIGEDSEIFVDVPQDVFDRAVDSFEKFPKVIEFPKRQRVVSAEPGKDETRLSLNSKRAGRVEDTRLQRDRLKHMIYALSAVSSSASREQGDPNMSVRMSLDPIGSDNRLGMDAVVKWPESIEDSELEEVTSLTMVQTAKNLRMYSPGLVYSRINRMTGVTLETNPIGSCSLDTDGFEYDPTSSTMELWGHNIYNHQIQLICLSGLIAIARA